MENNNKKILTFSYLIAAFVVAYSFGQLLEALSSVIPWLSRFTGSDAVKHGLPVVLGLGTFFGLQFSKKANVFFDEVVTEIRKIVWPSRRDTTAMTIVVTVMVVIAGFLLSMFDGVSGYLVQELTKIPLP